MAGYATPAWVNDASPAIDDSALLDIGHGIELAEHPYGVCSTAAATAAKTVTIDYSGTLTLFTGLTVRVKFTNGNTAASPTLDVNSTGAKSIVYGTSFAAGAGWTAGAVTELTYDGTNWVMSRAAAVDTTVTRGSTNLITSDAVFKTYQRTVNPNLLDNWFFLNPVNQRGQSSYSGAYYGIDRWKGGNAYGSATVVSTGYRITGTSNFYPVTQVIENGTTLLNGKTVTLSALTASGELVQGTATINLTSTVTYIISQGTSNGGMVMLTGNTSYVSGLLRANANSTETYVAIKLELGNQQTLCHNEGTDANPVWVLNEIPNYAEELAKCQRYLLVFKPITDNYCFISFANGGANNNAVVIVPTPVSMRSTPQVTFTGALVLNDRAANTVYSVTSITPGATRLAINSVCFVVAVSSAVAGRLYEFAIWNDSAGRLVISAEI